MICSFRRDSASWNVAAGVTCVGEVMDVGTAWEAMQEFGLQGVAYQEVFGPADIHADESFQGLVRKIEAMRSQQTETTKLGVSPHAPYTVAPRLFRMVKDFAKAEKLPVTIHIAEKSADEERYVRWARGHWRSGIANGHSTSKWPVAARSRTWIVVARLTRIRC